MKSLSTTLRTVAEEYVKGLKADLGDGLRAVVLFGSVARGQATPHSDIDLFIVVDELPRTRIGRWECIRAADQRIEAQLNDLRSKGIFSDVRPILKTAEEASRIRLLYLDFVEDAVILFDRDGFFAGVLRGLKRRMKELGSTRRRMGRIRYWELKPDYRPGEVFDL